MQTRQHTVLCVDDEENILSSLKRLLKKENYRLLTASSGKEGLEILAANQIDMVISDQRMPGMSGTELLKQIKKLYPDIIRIILTGYTDVDSITEAINEGSIYKFFLKPWNGHDLILEIRQALKHHDLIEANAQLHEMVLEQNEEPKVINENLEQMVAGRTHSLEVQNSALQLSHAILEDLPWPIIGISSEMMVVLANKAAQNMALADQPIKPGEKVGDYFADSFQEQLSKYITAKGPGRIVGQGKCGRTFEIRMIPLSGRFSGKGMILTMAPAKG